MPAPLILYLIRHGEVHNPDNILYGRMPGFQLSANGREQAAAAGRFLQHKNLAALYASPMQRTQETASIIARNQHLPIQIDDRLNEVHTPLDGTSHEELELVNHDLYTGNEPPYEQPRDVRRRILDFIQEMRITHANREIAVVSHGDIVVTMFMYAHGQHENDIGRSRDQPGRLEALGLPESYPATASISRLKYHTDDPDEVPEYTYIRPY